MAVPEIDPRSLDDDQLAAFIGNHRLLKAIEKDSYLDALAEQGKRKGKGLVFETTMRAIRKAAIEKRFLSYKKVAEASGADWNKVRYAIGPHFDSLLEYCHRKGYPYFRR
jgi:hypothetical protein